MTFVNLQTSLKRNFHEVCAVETALLDRVEQFSGNFTLWNMEQALQNPAPTSGENRIILGVCILSDHFLYENRERCTKYIEDNQDVDIRIIILSTKFVEKKQFLPVPPESIHLILPDNSAPEMIRESMELAFQLMRARYERLVLQSRLTMSFDANRRLTRVGQVMATEHNLDVLIELILQEARAMTAADGGSIYVVERRVGGDSPTHLRFKKSALTLTADEFLLPIDKNSMAGYCAVTGEPMVIDDLYALSGEEDYHFNDEFDHAHNYYSKSMMMIPMKNHRMEVIGVIQLINRKRFFEKEISIEEMKGDEVMPFTEKDMELISAMAGQAAVAIQNSMLLQDIHNLFEGFVKASVTAIEQRDPTTSGHSFRVAEFTVGLAQAVDRISSGPFVYDKFNAMQIRELRYASLLHDFGKVGVREKVLVKEKKLYSEQMELINWRFHYIIKALERDFLNKKIEYLKHEGRAGYQEFEQRIDAEFRTRTREIRDMQMGISKANEPTVVEDGEFELLAQISQHRLRLDDGTLVPFLTENELLSLSIRRGTLDQRERMEIESHVSHTYKFLIQIPWTQDLKRVADIARGHHEKLDGSGYPLGLREQEISMQTRMMTIADIYDALTAPDRPYKKSLPPDIALDILNQEVESNHVDAKLLGVFIEAGIFQKVSNMGDVDSF